MSRVSESSNTLPSVPLLPASVPVVSLVTDHVWLWVPFCRRSSSSLLQDLHIMIEKAMLGPEHEVYKAILSTAEPNPALVEISFFE